MDQREWANPLANALFSDHMYGQNLADFRGLLYEVDKLGYLGTLCVSCETWR